MAKPRIIIKSRHRCAAKQSTWEGKNKNPDFSKNNFFRNGSEVLENNFSWAGIHSGTLQSSINIFRAEIFVIHCWPSVRRVIWKDLPGTPNDETRRYSLGVMRGCRGYDLTHQMWIFYESNPPRQLSGHQSLPRLEFRCRLSSINK